MWGQEANTTDGRLNRSFLGRFSYGAGLRLTHFTSGGHQLDGRGSSKSEFLHVNSPRLTALNAAVQIRFRLLGRADSKHPLSLGFNIDLAGVTFGPARTALRRPPIGLYEFGQATPVRANLLLGNTNDRGTLNSEFYLNLRVAPRLNARLAFGHLAAGYSFDGNRYQRFFNLAVVGVSYGLGSAGHYY